MINEYWLDVKATMLENATFEYHIKEACDVINKLPHAFTEGSCEGHPDKGNRFPYPHIQGYAKTEEEF